MFFTSLFDSFDGYTTNLSVYASLVPWEIPNAMDEARLIEEVHKRRPLWDLEHYDYESRKRLAELWKEVADELNLDDGE